MVWIICIIVLIKPDLINSYLLLLISNIIVLFYNVYKSNPEYIFIILYRYQYKYYLLNMRSDLIYFIIWRLKNSRQAEGAYFY